MKNSFAPTAYDDACKAIDDLTLFVKKHTIDHTIECLRRLGHPERQFRVIHVAGTNGKGSVCAFTESILRRAGLKTGLFVSPHLITLRERICINGQWVSEEAFVRAFHKVRTMADGLVADGSTFPAYFEFLFLMGMVIFAEEGVHTAVLETGLGGRLDATSSVEEPMLSIITPIGLDHTAFLGDTIQAIAGEKAGILKPNVPLLYADTDARASDVIESRARELGIVYEAFDPKGVRVNSLDAAGTGFSCDGEDFHIAIPAHYEAENAGLVMAAMSLLSRTYPDVYGKDLLTPAVIKEGLAKAYWPGRMEQIAPGIYVDGAHNMHGMKAFLQAAGSLTNGQPCDIVFAVMADKDVKDMIEAMCRDLNLRHVYLTSVDSHRAADPADLQNIFLENGVEAATCVDVKTAFGQACAAKDESLLFCVGSLYMVGEVKTYI
ncbi:MAG: bifunctional folylpolyglutamate synthase/dihydrofolate synthase [Lachnospiraceae bacterium]|nr:bifunctional folylpolyglutamate synthase/dihydrofolate synthase [Candidatus Equihabitans merdae]